PRTPRRSAARFGRRRSRCGSSCDSSSVLLAERKGVERPVICAHEIGLDLPRHPFPHGLLGDGGDVGGVLFGSRVCAGGRLAAHALSPFGVDAHEVVLPCDLAGQGGGVGGGHAAAPEHSPWVAQVPPQYWFQPSSVYWSPV